MDMSFLKKLGFSDKAAKVYMALLVLGPSSVRDLAKKSGLNRGTVYDMLKWLKEHEVVCFYEKEAGQYFVAEDPEKLTQMLSKQMGELEDVDGELDQIIPELKSLYDSGGQRPVAKYFEKNEIHKILEDIIETCERTGEMEYRIYSAAGVREYLYENFDTFSDVRVSKSIGVKVIAIGEGGELRGMDERKWIKSSATKTYILIYPGKTAYISLDAKGEPVGVVIENEGVFETQKLIFDELWNSL